RWEWTALALPTPGEYHAAIGHDLKIFSMRDIAAVDVDMIDSAGPRVEVGMDALPQGHLRRVGEEWEDRLGTRRDANFAFDDITIVFSHGEIRFVLCHLALTS